MAEHQTNNDEGKPGSVLKETQDSAIAKAKADFEKAQVDHDNAVRTAETARDKAIADVTQKQHDKTDAEERRHLEKKAFKHNRDQNKHAQSELEKAQKTLDERQEVADSAEKKFEKAQKDFDAAQALFETADQALNDADGAAKIAGAQAKADIAAAKVALATAADARDDAISQAKTDYDKARDRPFTGNS